MSTNNAKDHLAAPDLQNYLLAALPAEEQEMLRPNLERVKLVLGEVLSESGDSMPYV